MSGLLLPQGQFYRLKAAFRDLVEKAGGLERAAERTGYGKSSLQRWASPQLFGPVWRNWPGSQPPKSMVNAVGVTKARSPSPGQTWSQSLSPRT